MLRSDLMKRISQLQLGSLPNNSPGPEASLPRNPLAQMATETDNVCHQSPKNEPHETPAQQLIQHANTVDTQRGKCSIIRRPINEIWKKSSSWLAAIPTDLDRLDRQTSERDLPRLRNVFPQQTMLLDLETCGFAGSMVFLAGIIHEHSGELVLTQILARDYSEEPALLQALWSIVRGCSALVTFNGKSFDWPAVMDRSVLHRTTDCHWRKLCQDDDWLARLRPPLHVDLLHVARRLWKDQLTNCKLQTLEKAICRRFREGDIPGSEIPFAYRDFVQGRDIHSMDNVLHHNALDLITLLQILLVAIRKAHR